MTIRISHLKLRLFLLLDIMLRESLLLTILLLTSSLQCSNGFRYNTVFLGKKFHRSQAIHLGFSDFEQSDVANNVMRTLRAAGVAVTIGGMLLTSTPDLSFADSVEAVNNKLSSYELPPILFVPPGFSPLASEFGRGNIREQMKNPILVQFVYPQLWVVQKTSVNNNGEAGTVSANGKFLYLTHPLFSL